LHLALEGLSVKESRYSLLQLMLASCGIGLLCLLFSGHGATGKYVPIELNYRGRKLHLTALTDTGNTLVDPITGEPVMVVGAQIAKQLLGLTEQQLNAPCQTLCTAEVPGMRLIPYKTIDRPGGMLLALPFKEVKIGKWRGSSLIAFAPRELGAGGKFQALIGGS